MDGYFTYCLFIAVIPECIPSQSMVKDDQRDQSLVINSIVMEVREICPVVHQQQFIVTALVKKLPLIVQTQVDMNVL